MKHTIEELSNEQLVLHIRNEAEYYKRKNLKRLLIECAKRIEESNDKRR